MGKLPLTAPESSSTTGKLVFAGFAFCLAIALGVAAAYFWSSRPFEDVKQRRINEQFAQANLGDRLNILLLGTDIVQSTRANARNFREPTSSLAGRSDTILLAHFDPGQKTVNVLSIPRDTRTTIPGHGTHKMNVANVYGGPVLAADAVSKLVGAPINRYVRINPMGVIDLINALGGVTVYIPRAMKYSDDSQHLYIDLPQGWHTLSGLQAQQYLRFRADELGDIGRVQRQQTLLRALADRAVRPETITRLFDILDIVKQNIDTNLSIEDIFALAKFARDIDLKRDLRMVLLPGRFSRPGEYEVSYWIPHTEEAARLGGRLFGGDSTLDAKRVPLSARAVRLTIQNATGQVGAARQLARQLQKMGFRSINLTSDRLDALRTTEILAQNGNLEAADLVRETLGLGAVRVESTGPLQADVMVRLGQDWLRNRATR